MVEAAMPMIGPGGFGPGAATGGSCDFKSCLSLNMSRMGTEQAIKSQAADLATARSELGNIDPIGIYKLLVGEATFRNKVTGELITERTLVSEDFNNEAIGVWSDAGEYGTGSKEEYQAILERARMLANIEGPATMFWISPGKEKRKDGLPEHRAYRWNKDASGEVTAYSYQFTGSTDSLGVMLQTLSDGALILDKQTLFWKRENEFITHERIFDAYKEALTPAEVQKSQVFLNRFQHETQQPDRNLKEQIDSYKREYEQKLRDAYKGDIQSAVEAVVSGFLSVARESLVEHVAPVNQRILPISYQIKDENRALPGTVINEIHDVELRKEEGDEKQEIRIRTKKKNGENQNEIRKDEETKLIESIVQPFVPAWVVTISQIVDTWKTTPDVKEDDRSQLESVSSDARVEEPVPDEITIIEVFVPSLVGAIDLVLTLPYSFDSTNSSRELDFQDVHIVSSGDILFIQQSLIDEKIESEIGDEQGVEVGLFELSGIIVGDWSFNEDERLIGRESENADTGNIETDLAQDLVLFYMDTLTLFVLDRSSYQIQMETKEERSEPIDERKREFVADMGEVIELFIKSNHAVEEVFTNSNTDNNHEKEDDYVEREIVRLSKSIANLSLLTPKEQILSDEQCARISFYLDLYQNSAVESGVRRFVVALLYLELKHIEEVRTVGESIHISLSHEIKAVLTKVTPALERQVFFISKQFIPFIGENTRLLAFIEKNDEELSRILFLVFLHLVQTKRMRESSKKDTSHFFTSYLFDIERLSHLRQNALNFHVYKQGLSGYGKNLPKSGIVYLYIPNFVRLPLL